jgi:hypothetical protein
MNKKDFFQWLRQQGCEIRPKEGINNSAPPIEVINKATGRYSYFALYSNSDQVSSRTVEKLIKDLGIEPPKDF